LSNIGHHFFVKIVIVGAGVVGTTIAARLVEEGHDVFLIDRSEVALSRATHGLDVQGIRGHGSRPAVLDRAGIVNADMLVAVTDSDEVNLVACLNGAILGPSNLIKIARIRDPAYADPRVVDDPRFAVDLVINPERATAEVIMGLLRYPDVIELVEFADGLVSIVGLLVRPNSPLAGLRLLELNGRFPEAEFLVAAITRGDHIIIPQGTAVILPGDELYVVCASDTIESVLVALEEPTTPVKQVAIFGGTRVGRFLAEALDAKRVSTKLFETDTRKARWLAEQLQSTVLIEGNPTDIDLLAEENIGEMQAVIACSREEEINVMAALLAKRQGAKRIITVTDRTEYRPVIRSVGFDACLSPRQVAVSSILHFIRHGRVVAVRALGDWEEAEAMEFEAQLASDAVGTPLYKLRLPPKVVLAALVRDGEVLLPRGDTVIEPGDRVVVVASTAAIPAVERVLQRRVDRVQ